MSFSMPFYRVALLKEEKDNLLTEFKSSLSLAGQKKKEFFFYFGGRIIEGTCTSSFGGTTSKKNVKRCGERLRGKRSNGMTTCTTIPPSCCVVIIDLWASLWTKPYKARRSPPCFAPEYGLVLDGGGEEEVETLWLFLFSPPFTFSLVFSPFILSGEGVVVVLGPTTTRYSRHIFFPSSFFSIHLFSMRICWGEKSERRKKNGWKSWLSKGHDDTSRRCRHQAFLHWLA